LTEAALVSVTLQVSGAVGLLDGGQFTTDKAAETTATEVSTVLPFAVAMISAFPSEVAAPALAVKVTLVAFCGTDIVVGNVSATT